MDASLPFLTTRTDERHFIIGSAGLWQPTKPEYVRFEGEWPTFEITGVDGGPGLVAKVTNRNNGADWQVSIPRGFIPRTVKLNSETRQACRQLAPNRFRFDLIPMAEQQLFRLLFRWRNLLLEHPNLEELVGIKVILASDDE